MDEQVKVDCRNCGTTLKLKASLAGKTVRCPRCKQPFVVELRATREPTDEEGPADPDDQFVAAFAHFTNCEFGGIAWGVGALTGIGMHIGGQGYGDSRSGWIAVGMALFSIVMGRFVTFLLFSGDMVDSLDLALGSFSHRWRSSGADSPDSRPIASAPVRNLISAADMRGSQCWESARGAIPGYGKSYCETLATVDTRKGR